MITLITGLIVKHFSADLAKRIIIKLLEIYVKRTDNTLDDQILEQIKKALEA